MPIAVTCTCGTNLEADDGPGPQTLKCPQCRRGIALFVAAPPRIEAPVFNQVQYHRRAWIGEDGLLRALCPECDFRIKAPPNLAGKQGRCPQCGTDVLLPRIDLPGLDPENLPPAIPADPIEAEPAKAKASSPKGPSPEEQVEAAMQEAQPDRSHEDFDDVDKLVQQIAAPEVAPTEPGKEVGRIGEDGLIRTLCIECGYRIKAPPSHAGKRGRCPRCRAEVFMPWIEPEEPRVLTAEEVEALRAKDAAAGNDDMPPGVTREDPTPPERPLPGPAPGQATRELPGGVTAAPRVPVGSIGAAGEHTGATEFDVDQALGELAQAAAANTTEAAAAEDDGGDEADQGAGPKRKVRFQKRSTERKVQIAREKVSTAKYAILGWLAKPWFVLVVMLVIAGGVGSPYIYRLLTTEAPTIEAPAPPKTPDPPAAVYFYDLNTGNLFLGTEKDIAPVPAPSGPLQGTENPAGVRAYIFACGDCANPQRQFVGWIEVFLPSVHETASRIVGEALQMTDRIARDNAMKSLRTLEGLVVRRVEQTEWWPANSDEGRTIMNIQDRCPPGTLVRPCEP